jgi:hypothetical protein
MPWAEHDQVSQPTPTAPKFHPEMGYLCPSPQSRRLLRVGLIAGACGLALGAAIAATALSPVQRPGAARAEAATTVGQTAADRTAAVAPAAQRACSEQTWPYIDRTCLNDASPKPPPARVLAPASTAAPVEGVRIATQSATPASAEVKPADEPQPPAASPPAREKTAQVRKKKRSRSRQDEPRSAYASPYGERNGSVTGYDLGARYDSGPRYPQQQRRQTWSGGWSW